MLRAVTALAAVAAGLFSSRTKDVEVRFGRPGKVALEMRSGAGSLFISQPIVVLAADSTKR